MSNTINTSRSQISLCESDAEALSQECVVENASQYSLSSDEEEGGEGDDDGNGNGNNNESHRHHHNNNKPVDTMIPVVPIVDPIPPELMKFIELAQQQQQQQQIHNHSTITTTLTTAMREFRAKWKKHHSTHLGTPSAKLADDKAEQMRMEFTNLIGLVGNTQLQISWSNLSPELCDKFVCHIFLPPELGGFFEAFEG